MTVYLPVTQNKCPDSVRESGWYRDDLVPLWDGVFLMRKIMSKKEPCKRPESIDRCGFAECATELLRMPNKYERRKRNER